MAIELAHVAIVVGLLSIEVMEYVLGDVIVHDGNDIVEPELIALFVHIYMRRKHVEYAEQMSRVNAVKIFYNQARLSPFMRFHILQRSFNQLSISVIFI